MLIINVIKQTWPFFKEMIIGKNSLRYAIRKNRVRVAFFFAVMLSFIVNWIAVPRLFMISSDYIRMEQELRATKETTAGYKEDMDSVSKSKEELLRLRGRVKELEEKQCPAVEPANNDDHGHDLNPVRSRLNNLGD